MIWPLAADGALQVTADTTGARYVNGFMRRPSDGALVVAAPPGAQMHNGFCVDASKFLCFTAGGAAVTLEHGFARGASRELVSVAADPAPAYKHNGLKLDANVAAWHPGHYQVQEDDMRLKLPGRAASILRPVLHAHFKLAHRLQVGLEQAREASLIID